MIITKRHLSRRAVLKGMGVTVALPFLEAMAPAAYQKWLAEHAKGTGR